MYKPKNYKVTIWAKTDEKVIKSYHYFFGVTKRRFDGLKRVEDKFKQRYGHTNRKIIRSEVTEIDPISFRK